MNESTPEITPPIPNRILVVEDDRHIRKIIAMGLKLEGYEVITAENGEDGLEKLKAYNPGAVTVDLMMPVMDGRTFIHKARSEMHTEIPIVVLTSVDRDEATRDLMETGASAILHKPANVSQIVATLRQLS